MGKDTATGWQGVGGHTWAGFDVSDGARLAAKFRDGQKRDHQAGVAARKVARDEQRRLEREGGGSIGPPNPFVFRKGFRPPMKI